MRSRMSFQPNIEMQAVGDGRSPKPTQMRRDVTVPSRHGGGQHSERPPTTNVNAESRCQVSRKFEPTQIKTARCAAVSRSTAISISTATEPVAKPLASAHSTRAASAARAAFIGTSLSFRSGAPLTSFSATSASFADSRCAASVRVLSLSRSPSKLSRFPTIESVFIESVFMRSATHPRGHSGGYDGCGRWQRKRHLLVQSFNRR